MEINNLLEGLKIIKQYQPHAVFYAVNGKVYCGEYNPQYISYSELETMRDNGWYKDDGYELWCINTDLLKY